MVQKGRIPCLGGRFSGLAVGHPHSVVGFGSVILYSKPLKRTLPFYSVRYLISVRWEPCVPIWETTPNG
jgi:hypothetical protein